jgi:hypothetical protein
VCKNSFVPVNGSGLKALVVMKTPALSAVSAQVLFWKLLLAPPYIAKQSACQTA